MKKMLLLVFALVLISWGQANADVFDFTFTGQNISASGTLDAVSNGDGSFTATGGSATANGVAMSLVTTVPSNYVSPMGAYYFDNKLYPESSPLLTPHFGGLLFTAAASAFTGTGAPTEVNIYDWYGTYYYDEYQTGYMSEAGTFTLKDPPDPGTNAVPEPVSLLFLGFGLVGIAGAKRKFSK